MTGYDLHVKLKDIEKQRSVLPFTHNLTPDVVKITVLAISKELGNQEEALRARLMTLEDECGQSGFSIRRDWELIGKELERLPEYVSSDAPLSVREAVYRVKNDVAKRQAGVERRLALLKEEE